MIKLSEHFVERLSQRFTYSGNLDHVVKNFRKALRKWKKFEAKEGKMKAIYRGMTFIYAQRWDLYTLITFYE